METEASDYDYAVFHQPNGKFPAKAAKMLGFGPEQVKTGMLVTEIGNTYSGAVLLGLCAILDEAKVGQRIFMVGYGSGAGSDGFDLTVTDAIESIPRQPSTHLWNTIAGGTSLDYATYARYRGKIILRSGG